MAEVTTVGRDSSHDEVLISLGCLALESRVYDVLTSSSCSCLQCGQPHHRVLRARGAGGATRMCGWERAAENTGDLSRPELGRCPLSLSRSLGLTHTGRARRTCWAVTGARMPTTAPMLLLTGTKGSELKDVETRGRSLARAHKLSPKLGHLRLWTQCPYSAN